jgi:DUF2934 family protein
MNGDNTEQLREKSANDEEMRESISLRAYQIYLSRGGEPGCEVEDWLQAENEVLTSLTEEQSPRTAPESTQPATDVVKTKANMDRSIEKGSVTRRKFDDPRV